MRSHCGCQSTQYGLAVFPAEPGRREEAVTIKTSFSWCLGCAIASCTPARDLMDAAISLPRRDRRSPRRAAKLPDRRRDRHFARAATICVHCRRPPSLAAETWGVAQASVHGRQPPPMNSISMTRPLHQLPVGLTGGRANADRQATFLQIKGWRVVGGPALHCQPAGAS